MPSNELAVAALSTVEAAVVAAVAAVAPGHAHLSFDDGHRVRRLFFRDLVIRLHALIVVILPVIKLIHSAPRDVDTARTSPPASAPTRKLDGRLRPRAKLEGCSRSLSLN